MSEQFTFFWGKDDIYSNWYPCAFSHQGYDMGCGEQAMMYRKSMLFNDINTAYKILKENEPKNHKKLGREVRGFKEDIWVANREIIVYEILHDKFTQNEKLLKQLLSTVGTTFVEASPYDEIWGIKLSASHPWAKDRSKWLGLNLLGNALTNLRDNLIKEGM